MAKKKTTILRMIFTLIFFVTQLGFIENRNLQTNENECGEWEITTSRQLTEYVSVSGKKQEDCSLKLEIKNLTSHQLTNEELAETILDNIQSFAGYSGFSFELAVSENNQAATINYISPSVFYSHVVFPEIPLYMEISPSDLTKTTDIQFRLDYSGINAQLDTEKILLTTLFDFYLSTNPKDINHLSECGLSAGVQLLYPGAFAVDYANFNNGFSVNKYNKNWSYLVDDWITFSDPMTEALKDAANQNLIESCVSSAIESGFENIVGERIFNHLGKDIAGKLLYTLRAITHLGTYDLSVISYENLLLLYSGAENIHISYHPVIQQDGASELPKDNTSQLGYIDDGTIYLLHIGSDPIAISPDPNANYVNFEFSPDGRFVSSVRVKTKEEGYGKELNMINLSTKEIVFKSSGNLQEGYHAYEIPTKWSPDNMLLLLNTLLISNNNGNVRKEILPEESLSYDQISWTPDSQSVIYIKESQDYQSLELIRYNVLFGLSENLNTFYTNNFGYCSHIQDPNTGWIAALGGCVEGQATLLMLHPSGESFLANQGKHIVFRGLYSGEWSPNGEMFAYTSGLPYPKAEIWILNVEDHAEIKLPQVGSYPTWSPDGGKIAYTTPKGGLEVYDLNTGKVTEVLGRAPNNVLSEEYTFGGGSGELLAYWQMIPQWSPDGRFIILPYPDNIERWDGGNPNKESDAGFYVVNIVTKETYWIDNGIRPQWAPK